jgi:hypothetical protein
MEATRISSLQLLSKNLWVNKGEDPNVYWWFFGNVFDEEELSVFN